MGLNLFRIVVLLTLSIVFTLYYFSGGGSQPKFRRAVVPIKEYDRCMNAGQAALTFDDGPTSPYTQAILQVLREEQVQATFHISTKWLSNVVSETIANQARVEGHIIGLRLQTEIPLENIKASELETILIDQSNAVYRATGVHPRFIRLPYSENPTPQSVTDILSKFGFLVTKFNVDLQDYTRSNEEIISQGFRATLDSLGDLLGRWIILAHDTVPISTAIQAGIQYGKEKGYKFINLGECTSNTYVYRSDARGEGPFLSQALTAEGTGQQFEPGDGKGGDGVMTPSDAGYVEFGLGTIVLWIVVFVACVLV